MKATEQYFHVVLFIMLYNVVCDHSNESYRAVYLSLCGTKLRNFTFVHLWMIALCLAIKMKWVLKHQLRNIDFNQEHILYLILSKKQRFVWVVLAVKPHLVNWISISHSIVKRDHLRKKMFLIERCFV